MSQILKVLMPTFGGDGGKSGISRYIIGLMREFSRRSDLQIDLPVYSDERAIFMEGLEGSSVIRPLEFSPMLRPALRNVLWHQASLPGLARRGGYDLLFLPAANRRLPLYSPIPSIGTVHDFSSIHLAGKYDPARMFYITRVLPFLIRRLGRVLTVSESSKADIVHYARVPADRVEVTPLAADLVRYHPMGAATTDPILAAYGIRAPYIFFPSRFEHPGKNHVRLIRAFDRARGRTAEPLQLVLPGKDWLRAEAIHAAAAAAKHAKDIIMPGFVREEDLPALYAGAAMMVFPSLYEGFGLPIIEAMACGAPVACSNLSSMPEVAGKAAILFNPESEEEIERAILDLLDRERANGLAAQGLARAREFDWATTAQRTVEAFGRLLKAS